MITFENFILLNEMEISYIDPEEDWDKAEEADKIAKIVKIRPDSQKKLTFIATHNDQVIGAVYTGWHYDNDHNDHNYEDKKVVCYSFDVVVHPKFQGFENVGIKLIQEAEKERNSVKEFTDADFIYTKLWVVNPKLANLLQSRKFNYQPESIYNDGSAHLIKY
jgi:hypothetical protein